MSRYRDQNIAIAAATFFILLAVVAWRAWMGPGDITKWQKVRTGMSMKQVEAILGGPAREVYLVEGAVQAIGLWEGEGIQVGPRVWVDFDTRGRAIKVNGCLSSQHSITFPYRLRNETKGPEESNRILAHLDFTDGTRRAVYQSSNGELPYVLDDEGHRVHDAWLEISKRNWWNKFRDGFTLPVLVDPMAE